MAMRNTDPRTGDVYAFRGCRLLVKLWFDDGCKAECVDLDTGETHVLLTTELIYAATLVSRWNEGRSDAWWPLYGPESEGESPGAHA